MTQDDDTFQTPRFSNQATPSARSPNKHFHNCGIIRVSRDPGGPAACGASAGAVDHEPPPLVSVETADV